VRSTLWLPASLAPSRAAFPEISQSKNRKRYHAAGFAGWKKSANEQKSGWVGGRINGWRINGEYDKNGAWGFVSVRCRTAPEWRGACVEVSADSLYEAVAQDLRVFRENDWIHEIGRVKPQFQLPSAIQRFSTRFAFRILNGGANRKGELLPR
jgi:hypothetical protein